MRMKDDVGPRDLREVERQLPGQRHLRETTYGFVGRRPCLPQDYLLGQIVNKAPIRVPRACMGLSGTLHNPLKTKNFEGKDAATRSWDRGGPKSSIFLRIAWLGNLDSNQD